MARKLAKSTIDRYRRRLEEEKARLTEMIEEARLELEEARQTESSAERSPDPGNAEAGSMKFEYEKELSMQQNSIDLLRKVEHALDLIAAGSYGVCEACGTDIPTARLDALPYANYCVNCASRR
jgi:DnaK suppressor protein